MMTAPRNVVITGYMGSGKSCVGRAVAASLGRPFLDMDDVLAERFGMPIPEVFRTRGEEAFRAAERALVNEISQTAGYVVATGGGALVDPANRAALEHTALLIRLTAGPDVLWERVARTGGRPMLEAHDRRARFDALLAEREPHYRSIPHQVDSSVLTVAEAAEKVRLVVQTAEGVGERCLTVDHPDGQYPVFITQGGLAALGMYMRGRGVGDRVAVICDSATGPLFGERVTASLAEHGFSAALVSFEAGEEHKTLATVQDLASQMAAAGLGRDCTVVALGGGVVGDTAGLVAALYMRGVGLVQAPTTLLAAFDSSVGGKVAVDLPAGKNLLGAFKQPEMVLIDAEAVSTLPIEERRAGLAEAVKHGVIADTALFEMLGSGSYELMDVIERSVRVKAVIVQEDPHEQGRRAVLNLGHTFGHAYERLSGFRLRHGEAVAIGMVLAAELARRRRLCDEDMVSRLRRCLESVGLPTEPPDSAPVDLISAMQADKKRLSGRLRVVLPLALGDVRVFDDVTEDELVALISSSSS